MHMPTFPAEPLPRRHLIKRHCCGEASQCSQCSLLWARDLGKKITGHLYILVYKDVTFHQNACLWWERHLTLINWVQKDHYPWAMVVNAVAISGLYKVLYLQATQKSAVLAASWNHSHPEKLKMSAHESSFHGKESPGQEFCLFVHQAISLCSPFWIL